MKVKMNLDDISKRLNGLHKLPPMPETAVSIMNLTIDPDTEVSQLAAVIERDPSLAAQIMRYARSALFSYRGELNSVKDAVHFVLGFDRVSQIAFGISAAKAFNIPGEGALGLKRFWQHSLYCAVLSQAFALMADPDLKLDEREAYLSGLLHNFGILLIGHILPAEFKGLNSLRESEPELRMSDIEQNVFGGDKDLKTIGHGVIGAVLLKQWKMPEAVVEAAQRHQTLNYQGKHQHYVHLVQLSNALLAEVGIGDEPCSQATEDLMASLGIKDKPCRDLLEALLDQCQSLDELICKMAA